MTATLNKEQILAANDLRIEFVDCPEWGGKVGVRIMTGRARDMWEQAMLNRTQTGKPTDLKDARAELLVATLCDDAGVSIFGIADIETLTLKSSVPIDRLIDKAQLINGLRNQDVEDAAKN